MHALAGTDNSAVLTAGLISVDVAIKADSEADKRC
jgi:hypothetical protein